MAFQECKCGCTIFETIRTFQYNSDDFYIDSRSKDIRAEVGGIPVAKCIQCGRISVPSTSMAGISVMDPRVGAYRELLRAADIRNMNIGNDHTVDKLQLDSRLTVLEEKVCACSAKEDVVVQTGTRGRKKSETAIPGPTEGSND